MIYAYLRVSTAEQDEENQRVGVDAKAKELNLCIDKYYVDHVSGTKDPAERRLGRLISRAHEGDVIIISELSRLGRRLFMLFRILECLLQKGVKVYSVKDGYALDNTLQSKVLAFAFGMAAEIERDMISQRTKEALALRKQQGVRLGRPQGAKTKNHKLNPYKEKILKWLKRGIPKARIARRCHVTDKTLRRYIENFC